jgi:4-amino-4-deoxy-L-arabinose transferase-like glycosyltransferase
MFANDVRQENSSAQETRPSVHFEPAVKRSRGIAKLNGAIAQPLLIFALVFAAMAVRLLLSPPISHHGEAREGLVIQEIVRDQQWILPLRNGELPSKPPLFHWIAALPALLFGLSDFTVRLPSALGTALMAITTFVMGRAVGGSLAAWLAVGSLLSMYEFWDTGTQARVDMIFSACIAISLTGFFVWYRDGLKAARAASYIGVTLAVLAKGPAGLALPAIVIVSFLFMEGRLGSLRRFYSWPLIALMLLIDAGWYGSAYYLGGNEFLKLQILRENIDRAFGIGATDDDNNLLIMIGWLITRTFPSGLVLLWSLIRRVRGVREDSAGTFLHAWWISIFLVFALAIGKRAVYLLPIYPAIAILAGRAMSAFIGRDQQLAGAEAAAQLPARRYFSVKTVGVSIVLMDLTLMLMSRNVWKRSTVEKARLAFINKLATIVPADTPIFATPELDNTELIVIAYRLHREIDRKPIACGERNEYFLAPFGAEKKIAVETRVLAASEMHDVSLLTLPSLQSDGRLPNCLRKPSNKL